MAWIIIGRIAAVILGIAQIRIATTLLPPEQYGFLALVSSIQSFAALILLSPIGNYFNRHIHSWLREETLPARFSEYMVWSLVCGVAGAFCALALDGPGLQSEGTGLAVALAASVTFSSIAGMAAVILNFQGQRGRSVSILIVSQAAGLLVASSMVGPSGSALDWYSGLSIGHLTGAAIALFYMRSGGVSGPGRFRLLNRSSLRTFIVPLSVSAGLTWVLYSGNRFIVEYGWGLVDLGLIAVALAIANQMFSALDTLFSQYAYPYVFASFGDTRSVAVRTMHCAIRLGASLVLISASAFVVTAPDLVFWLAGTEYRGIVVMLIAASFIEIFRLLIGYLNLSNHFEQRLFPAVLYGITGTIVMVLALGSAVLLEWRIETAIAAMALAAFAAMAHAILDLRSKGMLPRFGIANWSLVGVYLLLVLLMLALGGEQVRTALSSVIRICCAGSAWLLAVWLLVVRSDDWSYLVSHRLEPVR